MKFIMSAFQLVSRFSERFGLSRHGNRCGSLENSFVVVGLTAFLTVLKDCNVSKQFSFKVDMCRFAYTTCEKTLIKLRRYVRELLS